MTKIELCVSVMRSGGKWCITHRRYYVICEHPDPLCPARLPKPMPVCLCVKIEGGYIARVNTATDWAKSSRKLTISIKGKLPKIGDEADK